MEESRKFCEGIVKFDNEDGRCRLISDYIGTRTPVQVRNYALKARLKVEYAPEKFDPKIILALQHWKKESNVWTESEHNMFVEGVRLYGNSFLAISRHMGTRSAKVVARVFRGKQTPDEEKATC